jgi:hypothetical protein
MRMQPKVWTNRFERLRTIALAACATLTVSCASTEVGKVWKDDSRASKPIGKVLVIAVAAQTPIRITLEDEFVARLRERGRDAQASHTLMPGDAPLDKASVVALVKQQSFDTVLVSRLVQKKTVESEVARSGGPTPTAAMGYYGNSSDFYGQSRALASSPAYTIEHEVAVVQTNLYDAHADKLYWSAQSDTFLGDSAQSLIRGFVDVMVGQMAESKVL